MCGGGTGASPNSKPAAAVAVVVPTASVAPVAPIKRVAAAISDEKAGGKKSLSTSSTVSRGYTRRQFQRFCCVIENLQLLNAFLT